MEHLMENLSARDVQNIIIVFWCITVVVMLFWVHKKGK